MCNCTGNKNQTSKDVYEHLNNRDTESEGIGLFVIPAPENGIMEYKMISVTGITYRETVKRGQMCDGFKFIPIGMNMYIDKDKSQSIVIRSVEDLKKVYCTHGQYCNGVNCYGTCACLTYSNICYDYGKNL